MRTNQMSRIYLGRNVYGLAAVIFGVITFAWRDLNAWREIMPLGKVTHPEIFLYTAAAIELIGDRKSTRLNSSHGYISYAVFCLKKKKKNIIEHYDSTTYQSAIETTLTYVSIVS